MQSLRVFLSERLTAAAEEIFSAVEKTITEYKEEIFRSKDLEISRLRMQLKILISGRLNGTKCHAELRYITDKLHDFDACMCLLSRATVGQMHWSPAAAAHTSTPSSPLSSSPSASLSLCSGAS